MHLLPKCGDKAPWQNNEFASIDFTETALVYGGPDLTKPDRAAKRVWAKEKRSDLTESIEDATARIE